MADVNSIYDSQKIEIAERIAQCRKNKSIRMIDMAEDIGVGYEQYRRIEHGDVLVKTEHLIKMASIFKVSADYLLFGTEIDISDRILCDIITNKMSEDEKKLLRKFLEEIYKNTTF